MRFSYRAIIVLVCVLIIIKVFYTPSFKIINNEFPAYPNLKSSISIFPGLTVNKNAFTESLNQQNKVFTTHPHKKPTNPSPLLKISTTLPRKKPKDPAPLPNVSTTLPRKKSADSNPLPCVLQPPDNVTLPRSHTYMTDCATRTTNQTSLSSSRKLVVVYNLDWWPELSVFSACPQNCSVSSDLRLLPQADAVVVHMCRIKHPAPPMGRSPGQIWVAHCWESPIYYWGEHDSPAWKSIFNWTLNYRTDSDIFFPYGTFKIRSGSFRRPNDFRTVVEKKRRPAAWFVSNCKTQSQREDYVTELRKYMKVDIYGKCGSLNCSTSEERNCLQTLSSSYYFYLSFENSLCRDYVTEKLFKLYENVDVIPVVRGGADYNQYFPPNTFINSADFPSPAALAAHLKSLMANPEKYMSMLVEKDKFVFENIMPDRYCELCRMIHSPQIRHHQYPDIMGWTRNGVCFNATDLGKTSS